MGANVFCLKACDPSYENDYALCEREWPVHAELSWRGTVLTPLAPHRHL